MSFLNTDLKTPMFLAVQSLCSTLDLGQEPRASSPLRLVNTSVPSGLLQSPQTSQKTQLEYPKLPVPYGMGSEFLSLVLLNSDLFLCCL